MKSATFRTMIRAILFSGVLLTVGAATAGAEDPTAAPVAAKNLTQQAKAAEAHAEPGEPSPGLLPDHALSTLGAIALGIFGLLWARRHTAER